MPRAECLRGVLVGAGGMGRAWARLLRDEPKVEFVGWVDLKRDLVEAGARDLGIASVGIDEDVQRALERFEPDFVVDAAVPEAHHGVTLECLEAGVAVLGEKPLAASMHEARELVAASERTGVLFMVSQNRRYHPGLAAFGEVLKSGVGSIATLSASFYRAPHFGGFREEMASPLLVDMAIHTFDAARMLLRAEPVSVFCEEWNPQWSWYRGAACAAANFEMDDGSRFLYQGSWCASGLETSWESSWRAQGSHGTATWDGLNVLEVESGEGKKIPAEWIEAKMSSGSPAGIAGSLAEFIGALAGGPAPNGECHDNLRSLAMVHAALESSTTGLKMPVVS